MAINYTALASEINTDPMGLGYAPLVADGNDAGVATKLNTAGLSGETVFRSYTPISDVLAAIVLSEFNSLTAAQKTAVDQFCRGDRLRTGDANLRTTMGTLFGAGTTSRTNLTNVASKSATRGEALFGEGTVVSAQDVATALRG